MPIYDKTDDQLDTIFSKSIVVYIRDYTYTFFYSTTIVCVQNNTQYRYSVRACAHRSLFLPRTTTTEFQETRSLFLTVRATTNNEQI